MNRHEFKTTGTADRVNRVPYFGLEVDEIQADGGLLTHKDHHVVTVTDLWGETVFLALAPEDLDLQRQLVRVTIRSKNNTNASVRLPDDPHNPVKHLTVHREQIKTWRLTPRCKPVDTAR